LWRQAFQGEREPDQPTNKGVVDADPACLSASLSLRACALASLGPCPSPPRGKTASGASRSLVNPLGAASCILFDPSSYSRYQWRERWLGLGGCVRAPAPARPVNMAPRRSGPGTARSRRRLHFTWTPEHSRVTCPPWRVTSLSRVCFARRREVEAWRRDEVRFAAPGLVRCLHGSGRCQCQSPYEGRRQPCGACRSYRASSVTAATTIVAVVASSAVQCCYHHGLPRVQQPAQQCAAPKPGRSF